MDTKFLENGVAVWMIEFWFEQLDGLQFVGSEFSLFCNIAEWTNEILIEILSGMPNPQCHVPTDCVFANAGLFTVQWRVDGRYHMGWSRSSGNLA